MLRLVTLECIDKANVIYRMPPGGVVHVLSGGVVLEGRDRPQFDEIGRRIKFRTLPVEPVQALVHQDAPSPMMEFAAKEVLTTIEGARSGLATNEALVKAINAYFDCLRDIGLESGPGALRQ